MENYDLDENYKMLINLFTQNCFFFFFTNFDTLRGLTAINNKIYINFGDFKDDNN